ncbi:hypothetical protein NLJ89_g581 [Agrocybe chaxingu]|uniref:Uncharacterized protein n=1 Tax=Agrocybe chaxingu TaxID=84603 RepID=A0A9W8N1N1_9AGAR|nr:hypothetical protein NLJ89_g581 [Agrocybe chaxingu]
MIAAFFGFYQKDEVLLVPVGTLFAFPQLRQSMPGALLDLVQQHHWLCWPLPLFSPPIAIDGLPSRSVLSFLTEAAEKSQNHSCDPLFEAFPMQDHRKTKC